MIKQATTKVDMEQLSKKGKLALMNWYFDKIDGLPLLNIGQMLEYLEDNTVMVDNDSTTGLVWVNKTLVWDRNNTKGTELCDALWEAVKNDLEKQANKIKVENE